MSFEQTKEAQRRDYARALAELRAGAKHSHWIWYVFPQLKGLGSSTMALRYALPDARAAKLYWQDDELRARLLEATEAVHEQLVGRGVDVVTLMGADIDALKLVSSLTLFAGVVATLPADDDTRRFMSAALAVLDACDAQGYPRCAFTERALRLAPP